MIDKKQAPEAPKAADFAAFMLSDTSVLPVLDPLGNPLEFLPGQPVEIEMYGGHTERYANAIKLLKPGEVDAEVQHKATAAFLAALTKDVRNFPFPGGAEAIYLNRAFLFIKNQAFLFQADMGNFWPAGKKS